MSNILYISPYLDIGGTEKHLLDLIRNFSEKDKVFLLAPPGKTVNEFKKEEIEYYPFPRLDLNLIKGLKTFFKQFKAITEKNQIDLIHIHGAPELMLLIGLKSKEIPILFTVHGFHGPRKSWDYWLCARLCNKYASQVIAVAGAEEDILLEKGIKPDLIQTIHNGVPDPLQKDLSRPEIFKENNSKTFIGAVARLETTKGLNFLIDAFNKIQAKFDNLQLIIVGSGSKETELKEQVRSLNLEEKVNFEGYRSNVHDYLNNYDIFVIPSLHEAHPLVLMEGMSHGNPIIATTVGGIPEVIEHQENGLLIPASDSTSLASALEKLLRNTELKEKLGNKARQTYEEGFTVNKMAEKTEKVYRTLL